MKKLSIMLLATCLAPLCQLYAMEDTQQYVLPLENLISLTCILRNHGKLAAPRIEKYLKKHKISMSYLKHDTEISTIKKQAKKFKGTLDEALTLVDALQSQDPAIVQVILDTFDSNSKIVSQEVLAFMEKTVKATFRYLSKPAKDKERLKACKQLAVKFKLLVYAFLTLMIDKYENENQDGALVYNKGLKQEKPYWRANISNPCIYEK